MNRASLFLLFWSRWPLAVWWPSTWLRSTIGRLSGPSMSCSSGPGWAPSSLRVQPAAGLFWMDGPRLRWVPRLSSSTVTRTWCLPAPTMRTRTGSPLRGLPSPSAFLSWPLGPFRFCLMFSVAGAPAPGCWIPSRPGSSCRRTWPLRPRSLTVSCGRVRAPAGPGRGAFPISRSRAHTHRRHGHPLQTVPSAGLIERPQEKNRVDALR